MYDTKGNDTICALSTPAGMGAIAVVRISGPDAFSICAEIFRPADRKLVIQEALSHTVHFGSIAEGSEILDEVLVTIFRAPHSYSGEDVIEISCHGSVFIQQKLLELLYQKGIRQAGPGEFTLRAFINGKFDLSQAEAVADLIASHSASSHDLAISQMRGGYSKKIKELRERLLDFVSLIELELDFSEENVEFASRTDLRDLLTRIDQEITTLVHSFTIGNVIKNGIPVAIIGKPNVGKSTLLNAILNEEKAIVSEIPGTTRDAIEDTIVIGGYSFRFIDTAGLRESDDTIESMGIERTWEKIHQAAIIFYVFDATTDSYDEVMESVADFRELSENKSKHLLLVGNKTDQLEVLPKGFKDFSASETIFVSAKRKENIHLLAESLLSYADTRSLTGSTIISNARHLEALKGAQAAIASVTEGLQNDLSPDLLSTDIHMALHHLGEITGQITTDDILGNIFGKFCIGK